MRKKMIPILGLGILLLFSLGADLPARDGQWSVFGYFSYANGNYYLTETTRSYYVAGGFRYRTLKWNVSFSLPWIIQNSNLVQRTGSVYFPMGPEAGSEGAQNWPMGMGSWGRHRNFQPPTSHYITGIGDLYGYASYQLRGGEFATFFITANAQLKVPTARRDFGTGEWDYGGSFTFQKIFNGHFSGSLELGYLVIGDPDSIRLMDPVFGTATATWFFSSSLSMSLYYLWYSTIQEGIRPPRYINLATYIQLTERVSLVATLGRGLTRASANITFFTSLELTL